MIESLRWMSTPEFALADASHGRGTERRGLPGAPAAAAALAAPSVAHTAAGKQDVLVRRGVACLAAAAHDSSAPRRAAAGISARQQLRGDQ